ncbi:MAG TPA: PilN domain-containing protein [Tepidisphaeraceae bacterium]
MSTSHLCFLPDDYLSNKRNRRTHVLCGSLLVVMSVTLGSALYLTHRSLQAAVVDHEQVTHNYANAAKRLQQFQTMQKQQELLSRQADISASLIDRLPRSDVLAQITHRLPPTVWLVDLEMMTKKRVSEASRTHFDAKSSKAKSKTAAPEPPAPVSQEVSLRLIGIASDDAQVASLISSLNDTRLFSEVNLLISAEEAAQQLGRRFTLELLLRGDADRSPARAKTGIKSIAQVQQ